MKSMSAMRKNEQGMASILITMIMIIVITLIVIGYAQVTRRNSREALDNQLSTQAYYAAESGVNAAANYLSTNPSYSTNTMGDCKQFINTLGGSGVLNSSNGTQYTCLMVDPNPTSLNLSPLDVNSSTVLHLDDESGQDFEQLNFHWAEQANSDFPDTNPTNNCSSAANLALPENNVWNCPYGILRIDLVDGTAADISNTTLQNNETVTSLYLIPSYQSGGNYTNTISMSSSPAWQPVADNPTPNLNTACVGTPPDPAAANTTCPVRVAHVAKCNVGGCSVTLDIAGGKPEYYARVSMMYQGTSSLTVTAKDASQPLGSVEFTSGQAVVDSTGQSEDELRRIQVRVPLVSTWDSPAYGLQTSDSICKLLSISSTTPGSTATDNCTDR